MRPGASGLSRGAQRDVQAIGEEGDEDVRFDALLELMVDRAQLQIVLEVLECGFDLDELDVELPQLGRVAPARDWCAADSDLHAGAPGAASCD